MNNNINSAVYNANKISKQMKEISNTYFTVVSDITRNMPDFKHITNFNNNTTYANSIKELTDIFKQDLFHNINTDKIYKELQISNSILESNKFLNHFVFNTNFYANAMKIKELIDINLTEYDFDNLPISGSEDYNQYSKELTKDYNDSNPNTDELEDFNSDLKYILNIISKANNKISQIEINIMSIIEKWKSKHPLFIVIIFYTFNILITMKAETFISEFKSNKELIVREENISSSHILTKLPVNSNIIIIPDDYNHYYHIMYYDNETKALKDGFISKRSFDCEIIEDEPELKLIPLMSELDY